jgi:hypothetical protein
MYAVGVKSSNVSGGRLPPPRQYPSRCCMPLMK